MYGLAVTSAGQTLIFSTLFIYFVIWLTGALSDAIYERLNQIRWK